MLSDDVPSLFGPRQHGQSAGYAVVVSMTVINAATLALQTKSRRFPFPIEFVLVVISHLRAGK
jgi:hypothetical protein